VALSGRVFAFAAATTAATALTAGLLPAWRSTRSLRVSLGARGHVSDPGSGRALHLLAVIEVGSAVLLVVGSALLVQTVLNLQRRHLGFDAAGLLSVGIVRSPTTGGGDFTARTDAVLSNVAALPGVTAAAATSALPFSGQNSGNTFAVEGRGAAGEPLPDTDFRVVSTAYFQTLRIPIQEGRTFEESEDRGRGVVVISRTAARRFWPDGSPLGRRLKLGRSDWLTIVGVAGDARYGALDDPDDGVRPMMYVPHWQMPSTPVTVVLRANVDPGGLADAVRRTLTSDGGIAVGRIETMSAMLREASASQRFAMHLLAMFAATAVALAMVGLYGTLAFLIARRTREIGVRFALGATHWDVVRMVVGRTLALVAIGVTGGLLASAGVSGLLRSVLFGVSANDPATYGAVALGFALLGITAAALPTIRALRIDPVGAIRCE
jgi:predicted permease